MKTLIRNVMKKQNIILSLLALVVGLGGFTSIAYAQAEDLVNTESFFIIDDGDGTTDVELQFGNTLGQILEYNLGNSRFEFSDDLYIQGALESSGDLTVGGNVITSGTVDGVDVSDLGASVLTNTGDIATNTGDIATNASNISTNTSNIATNTSNIATNAVDISTLQGQAHDQNTDTGTDSNGFLLDSDDTGGNVGIQFGTTLAELIRWEDASSRFSISDDLYVDGTLEINGNLDFNQNQATEMVLDQGTAFPTVPGPIEGQTFYRTDLDAFYIYDGSSWVAFADVSGTNALFLSPLYPNASYYEDGLNNTGKLTYYYDDTNVENAYRWETTRPADQDYDIKVRVQLPDNFASWDAADPIEFKYRTDTTSTAENQIDFTMLDTAEAAVTMSNNAGLASAVAATWVESTNMTITGGTWTAGGWFTVTIKVTADNGGGAEPGSIVLNYNTSS